MRKAYVGILVMVCSLSWPMAQASAQLTSDQVTALQNLLKCVSVQGTDLIVKGCNVHIRNGDPSEKTDVKNGLGNLIIGYNAPTPGQDRTGSHNLVIGDEHTYSSTGGLVAGFQNRLFGSSASVTGGFDNTAGGLHTSI